MAKRHIEHGLTDTCPFQSLFHCLDRLRDYGRRIIQYWQYHGFGSGQLTNADYHAKMRLENVLMPAVRTSLRDSTQALVSALGG